MIYRDMHDGPSSCAQFLCHLLLLPFLPSEQQALLPGLAAHLLHVAVGNSLLDLVADMETAGMPHERPREVLQHKQSQIVDILQDLGRLADELVQAVLDLVAVDSCLDRIR